jgi:hypothetical protein
LTYKEIVIDWQPVMGTVPHMAMFMIIRTLIRLGVFTAILAGIAGLPARGDSLLANPGFETNGVNWGRFGNVDVADWGKETGTFGAIMQGWVFNGAGGFFQSVKGTPDQTYTFSIRGRKEYLFQAMTVYIRLEFYGADDATKIGHDQGFLNLMPQLTDTWQTFTTSGKAPFGTVYVRAVLGFEGASTGDLGSGKQACVFDNAELIASDGP